MRHKILPWHWVLRSISIGKTNQSSIVTASDFERKTLKSPKSVPGPALYRSREWLRPPRTPRLFFLLLLCLSPSRLLLSRLLRLSRLLLSLLWSALAGGAAGSGGLLAGSPGGSVSLISSLSLSSPSELSSCSFFGGGGGTGSSAARLEALEPAVATTARDVDLRRAARESPARLIIQCPTIAAHEQCEWKQLLVR